MILLDLRMHRTGVDSVRAFLLRHAGFERHSALRAISRPVALYLWMHRAHVFRRGASRPHIYLCITETHFVLRFDQWIARMRHPESPFVSTANSTPTESIFRSLNVPVVLLVPTTQAVLPSC